MLLWWVQICNAGAMAPPERQVTVDGHEAHYQVSRAFCFEPSACEDDQAQAHAPLLRSQGAFALTCFDTLPVEPKGMYS